MIRCLFRGLGRLLRFMLLLVLLLMLMAWFLLQTSWFYERLEDELPRRLEAHGVQIGLDRPRGPLPGRFSFDGLRVSDDQGTWLVIRDFSFHIRLLPLLLGRIEVARLEAGEVLIERGPETPAREAEREPRRDETRSFKLPVLIRRVVLERLVVERLSLGEALTGEAATFELRGSLLFVPWQEMEMDLRLARTDKPLNLLHASASFSHGMESGRFHARMTEEAGGWLEGILGEAYSPLDISITGAGERRDWRGLIRADMGRQTRTFAFDAPYRFRAGQILEMDWTFRQSVMPGHAAGHLRVIGPLLHPSISFTAEARGVDLSPFAHYPLEPLQAQLDVLIQDDMLRTTIAATGLKGFGLEGSASFPGRFALFPPLFEFAPERSTEGLFEAEIDLASLAPLAQTFQQYCSGRFRGHMAWRGTGQRPELEGALRLNGGRYENLTWGTVLRDINLAVGMRENRIGIDTFTARDWSDGTLGVSGGLVLGESDEEPLHLRLRLDHFSLANDLRLGLVMDADIEARGSLNDLVVAGTSTIQRASINLQHAFAPSIPEVEVIEVNKPGQERASAGPERERERGAPARNVHLDLAIRAPGRIFVRGRGLNAEWQSRIDVRGSVHEPRVTGGLDLVRGSFVFLDRRMRLIHCGVYFDGGWPVSPRVDVQATATAGGIQITLRIHGSLNDLQIDLRSDPVRPQNETLSLLLFGKPPGDLSAVEALRMAYGLHLLTGGFDAMGALDTQTFLPVDQLAIQQGGDDAAILTVGKYLTDQLYVEADKSLRGHGDAFTVEISLTPFLQLRGRASTDESEGQSIYLHWHHSYE